MFSKKVAGMGAGILLSMMVMIIPAFAHGHYSGGHHRQAAGSSTVTVNHGTAKTQAGCPVHTDSTANCLVCEVEGCAEAGHHYHNDTVYCGYPHQHGYCDGTCVQTGNTTPSVSSTSTRSYGCHHGC